MNELRNHILNLLNQSAKNMSQEDYINLLESLSFIMKYRAEKIRNNVTDAETESEKVIGYDGISV